jgi:hypothetical protein
MTSRFADRRRAFFEPAALAAPMTRWSADISSRS